MKLIRPFVSGVIACGIALAMTTTLTAQTAEQGTVKVVNLKGSARYFLTGDPTPHPIKVGDILKPGAIIQTAASSYVDVVLNNAKAVSSGIGAGPSAISSSPTAVMYSRPSMEQDAVRILEKTVLGIEKLNVTQTGADRVTETELDLKDGKIFGTVKKLSAGSKYNIKIPNGVAAIRGTVYFISSTGEVSVLSSLSQLQANARPDSMILAYIAPDGTAVTQVIAPGQHFETSSGQLSPIPDSTYQSMMDWVRQLAVAPGGQVIVFPVDHTVYFLSGLFEEQIVGPRNNGGQGQGGESPGGLGVVRQGQSAPQMVRK
jgi:hypothetical protein